MNTSIHQHTLPKERYLGLRFAIVRLRPTPPAFKEIRRIKGSLISLPNSSIVVARCAWLMDPSKRLFVSRGHRRGSMTHKYLTPSLVKVVSIKSKASACAPEAKRIGERT
jgi:hypothetical protein